MLESQMRVGLLVPSPNTVMEGDFHRRLPNGVTLHTARMYLRNVDPQAQETMLDEEVTPAVRRLASVEPDAVVFGCTSAGALRGNAYDEGLCTQIENTTGAPTVSVLSAVRQALADRSTKVVGVITPYTEQINLKVRESLEADGLIVAGVHGLGVTKSLALAKVPPRDIRRLAIDCFSGAEIDTVFASCTNFRALEVAGEIARTLNVPVVTSNSAALEWVGKRLGFETPVGPNS